MESGLLKRNGIMSKRSKLTEYFKTKEEAVAYHDELMANP